MEEKKMIDASVKSLLVLANVIEARDPYTGGHLWRVSQFAKLLAIKMGHSETEAIQISLGGYVHDIGKIGIPEEILLKEDKLSEAEYALIRTHPLIGKKLIDEHPFSKLVSKVIMEHHERVNGGGYPRGLSGEDISPAAKIVAIADTLDALTSPRPYRREIPLVRALPILEMEAETYFDSLSVEHIRELGRGGNLSHIIGHSAHEIPMVTCPACGPVITVQRTARDGDIVFCRTCKGELSLHQKGESFEAEMHGKTDNLVNLQVEVNSAGQDDLMKEFKGKFKKLS